MSMNILIFGAGSIGCYLGGQLLNAGCNVTLLGREKLKKDILKNGLTLTHFTRDTIYLGSSAIKFTTNENSVGKADIIIVTVKSQDTMLTALTIAKFVQTNALIISFQNGVSNVGVLNQYLLHNKVLGGVVPFNVTGTGPGKFHCGTEGDLSVQSGDIRLDQLVKAFAISEQGLDLYDDIIAIQWGKLLVNLNNALNTLTGGTLRSGLMQRDYRKVLAKLIEEGLYVVRASGVEPANFGKASADKMIKVLRLPNIIYRIIMNKIVKIDASARSSMLDDLEMGRHAEVDYLQGAIVKLAKQMGENAPYNEKILNLVNQAFVDGKSPYLLGTDLCRELGI